MGAIRTENRSGVLIISVDLPGEGVNKINEAVRLELEELMSELETNPQMLSAVLISSKPDNFIAGADIEEFVALEDRAQAEQLVRAGQALISRIEDLGKPVVAAINGACLGGGYEAALGCTYRIATTHPKTVLGLPEVQLGIIPAAGGCQRLPRLIGLRAALDIILTGKSVPAQQAHRLGMVDEIVHPAILLDVAVDAAQRLHGGWKPKRRRASLTDIALEKNWLGRSIMLRIARRQVQKKTHGHYPGPFAAIEAVECGLTRGIKEGLAFEADRFSQLAMGDVCRKLVQIFFATRALKKDNGVEGGEVTPRPVANVGVVGAGFMGAGIASVAVSRARADVRFQESDWNRLGAGLATVRDSLKRRLKQRRITKYEYRELVSLVSGGVDWSGFRSLDLVIEAVFEDLDLKRDILSQIERVVGERCILASNTSTIPIATIADVTQRPDRVLGMHFFSPVERMPLLEVIVAEATAPWATATAVAFGKRLGKTVIVARDHPGFWVNRILSPYLVEAGRLIEEGIEIEALERSMVEFGFPVGPITLLDEVGLDVAFKASSVMQAAHGERMQPPRVLKHLVESGRLGRKSGQGFYRYKNGKRASVDPSVYDYVAMYGRGSNSEADIEHRLVYSLLNEAARTYDEGVVRSPRDGDLGAIFGLGFPPFRGGPLRYLDSLGPSEAISVLDRLRERYGERFTPAPILAEFANKAKRFYPD